MAATILNLDAANLFVGDDDPSDSLHLVLKSVKLPALEEKTKDHSPGGGIGDITMGMRSFNTLVLGFNTEGMTPNVMKRFMPSSSIPYTIRGNLRNIKTHADIPVLAVVTGRMTKVDISEFKKDDGIGTEYEIKEIVHYMLKIGTEEKFYFDVFSGPRGYRIDGVNPFEDLARNLGL